MNSVELNLVKKNIRWIVVAMLFVATGLSFLDRQVLSMVIVKIQSEFNLSNVQYGFINTGFLIGYAIMFTVSGRLMDTLGTKVGLTLSVGLWSIANTLHGVASGFVSLLSFRFLLGLGEGGCFPGAAKVVYERFEVKERAFANGIAIGGSAIGAVIAPPLTIYMASTLGWRWAFVIPGMIGIVWVLLWLLLPKHKRDTGETDNGSEIGATSKTVPFISIIKNKHALVFMLMRFLLDPIFYFLMFWVPKYLSEERHISFERIGELFWIPFLALGVSNIIGGQISDRLIKWKFSVNKSRKIVMGLAAALTLVAPLVQSVSTVEMAIFLMSLFMFAHGFWITNYITSISDIFGNEGTGTVVGLSGTAGAIAGLLLNPVIGYVVQNYSYSPLWIASGLLYPIAFVFFMIYIPKIQPLYDSAPVKI